MTTDTLLEPGVSLALARRRDQQVSKLSYELRLDVPADPAAPVTGQLTLLVWLNDPSDALILDYASEPEQTSKLLIINGESYTLSLSNEHLVIPASLLRAGENVITTDFVCAEAAVKRTPDLTYSLFVPANARFAFPCLDQPSLRARFTLTARLPEGWTLLTNAAPGTPTLPLPTYLMAFVAGRLSKYSTPEGFTFYYPEARPVALADLDHAARLMAYAYQWMTDYTCIACPFDKKDVVLIPGMRYGGMEHPGCVYFKTERIITSADADDKARYRQRNALIHEWVHLWLGDLVTLRWFGDVWLKEALANWATDKIVASLSQGGEEMDSLNRRRKAATLHFREQRGGHEVVRRLANLNQATGLYDAIIYQQVPFAFKHLERLMGGPLFRQALHLFITRHALGCASWSELRAACEEVAPAAGIDFDHFEREWLYSTHLPEAFRHFEP